ncbi:unnamed protein product [Polarella glacialis]|uniref:Uncharacterized protein n=1 Tax=Polarella glacialis TaxID=89957 RepID=A0A813H1Z6_POLGL|nr:unnamed protein product [Polarella glacialis]
MTDRSLVDFLKASRPLWKQPQLEAVEKKLQKVGVRSLLELVIALRGAADQSLNNRLLAVGERCFTSETLTAFGAFLGEDEASDAQFHRKVSGEGTLNEEVAMHTLSVLAPSPSPSKGSLHPPPQPSSKDAMRAALAGLGLHLHVQRTCPARELRALLLEAHRCRGLSRADLLAECRGRLGLPAAAAAAAKTEVLVRSLLGASFPSALEASRLLPGREGGEEGDTSPSALSLSAAGDEDVEDPVSFEILAQRPEPLSLSTLSSDPSFFKKDLGCRARLEGLEGCAPEVRSKGVLAFLLKMESRVEYLQLLQASAAPL